MIYGVEGNVNVGKTTFIKKYVKNNNLKILNETPFLAEASPYDRQIYYINSEVQKKEKFSLTSAIMDRTILSVYLYTLISKEFTKKEKINLIQSIQKMIYENKVLVPDKLIFITYPFELINSTHNLLSKEKNTQNVLVSYDYYSNYTLFFSNTLNKKQEKILNTENNRQIILSDNTSMYYNLQLNEPKINSVILLDGAPAIGKTTIGKKQIQYDYVPEQNYKKYTISSLDNQIESIIQRINLLRKNNVLLDTSFLMGITHLFYSHGRKFSKTQKLDIINKIVNNVPLYLYVTKIIYLYTDINTLEFRKNSDKLKPRKHFFSNIQYLNEEIKFYKILNSYMSDISNIYLIEASDSTDNIIKEINSKQEKPVFLIDLFYYIIKAIEKGEL